MIFSSGCDSIFEALYLKKDLTPYESKADIIVNPTVDTYFNKVIIFSMPTDINFAKDLAKFNKIISRYKLDNIEYKPYDESIYVHVEAFKESNNLYFDKNFKTLPGYYSEGRLNVIKAKFGNLKVENDLTFLGYLDKLLNMNLNTYVSACLCMAPFDSFAYAKLLPDPVSDRKLAEFLINKFNLTPDTLMNLHVAKIENGRIQIFKEQVLKNSYIESTEFIFKDSSTEVLCTRYKDNSTSVIIIEEKERSSYMIY